MPDFFLPVCLAFNGKRFRDFDTCTSFILFRRHSPKLWLVIKGLKVYQDQSFLKKAFFLNGLHHALAGWLAQQDRHL